MKIDYSQDSLLTEFSLRTLQDRYMIAGETSPQEAFARAADAFADDDDHAQRLYDYASKLMVYVLYSSTFQRRYTTRYANLMFLKLC
jgi:ribonucleotide reductase alpha subunit